VDGRDRVVDLYAQARRLGLGPTGSPLVYWGKYTAHDNNRDAMVLSQRLTQAFSDGFLHWRPTVAHDLHESVPFLYTSTGTGPYNDEYDPIVVSEWNQLAQQEIAELTRRGLPGVWTHGFYDGWAANYTVLSVANLRNSVGRFYETYTSMGADCHTVQLPPAQLERVWYRTNPPVNGVRWCIRSNINYQQSGVLVALAHVARHRETFLANAAAKAERMVQRGRTRAPYAYVVPRAQRRAAEAADLVNLFRRHGSEVHVATAPLRVTLATGAAGGLAGLEASGANAARAIAPGDWIVRMDQPYTATVRTAALAAALQADDPAPYDDTGWTLDALRGVETFAVADSAVLALAMTRLDTSAAVVGHGRRGRRGRGGRRRAARRAAPRRLALGGAAVARARRRGARGGARLPRRHDRRSPPAPGSCATRAARRRAPCASSGCAPCRSPARPRWPRTP
jgi:hypothetical protein